jgi:ABC-type dipeptide/oligopeptide/nickel transport system permease subunit
MKKSIYFWKKILLASLFSLSIFIFAFQPILAAEDDGNDSGSLSNPGLGKRVDATFDIAGEAQSQGAPGTANLGAADGGFGTWVSSLMRVVMLAGVLVAFVFLILGAIEWITSGGDKGKVESARGKITNAVIGLIVLAAVTAILALVQDFLGVSFINF